MKGRGTTFSPFNTTLTLVVFDFFLSREELFSLVGVVHSAQYRHSPFATLYDGDTILVSTGKKKVSNYLSLNFGIIKCLKKNLNSVTKPQGWLEFSLKMI